MRREKLLFMGPANDQLGSWVRIVIRNVEAIKSIEDWETQTPASRKRFHLALAKEVNAEAFERLERIPYPSKVKKKETTKLVTKFRKCHDKVIVQRRCFKRLFDIASFESFIYPYPTN